MKTSASTCAIDSGGNTPAAASGDTDMAPLAASPTDVISAVASPHLVSADETGGAVEPDADPARAALTAAGPLVTQRGCLLAGPARGGSVAARFSAARLETPWIDDAGGIGLQWDLDGIDDAGGIGLQWDLDEKGCFVWGA